MNQQNTEPPRKIAHIQMTQEAFTLVMEVLAELPFKQVAGHIQKISAGSRAIFEDQLGKLVPDVPEDPPLPAAGPRDSVPDENPQVDLDLVVQLEKRLYYLRKLPMRESKEGYNVETDTTQLERRMFDTIQLERSRVEDDTTQAEREADLALVNARQAERAIEKTIPRGAE